MTESTLLAALLANESGGRNINNTTQGTSSGQAQGFFQITTGTWDEFGGQKYASNPQAASYADQAAIASKIPLRRWDSSTIARMRATGIPVNISQTLGENLANAKESFSDFKPGSELPVGKKGAPTAVAGSSTTPVAAPQTPAPPNPLASLGSSLGETLSQMSTGGGGSGSQIIDPPDQPAIRTPAMETDFTPPPANPVPQTLAGGIGPTLGSIALQPQPLPSAVEDPGSITAGAPSMTGLLGGVGTATDPTLIDPRRTGSINPYTRPLTRLG